MVSSTAPFSAYFPLVPNSKIPAVEGWQHLGPGQTRTTRDAGINLQANELIIDIDAYKPEGASSLEKLKVVCPEIFGSYTVHTPKGGLHVYAFVPGDRPIKQKQSGYPGVEFQNGAGSHRRYAVAYGSVVPEGTYTPNQAPTIINLPKAFLDSLESPEAKQAANSTDASLQSEPQFISECKTWPPATANQRGNDTTYQLACRARDYSLPLESAYTHLQTLYNPRCQPPWSDTELRKLVMHAYEYAKNTQGVFTPQAVFTPEPQQAKVISIDSFQHDKVMETIHRKEIATGIDKNGKQFALKIQSNVIYVLREHAAWKGRILYNQFADRLEIKGRPDWRREQMNSDDGLNAMDLANLQGWFSASEEFRFELGIDRIESACFVAASHYHPVIDYLNGLKWDGKARLDGLFPDTTGCANTKYTRAAGAKTLISAVKRIFEPGCKHDYVPVFESQQGKKKSQWIGILGGAWASVGELVQGDKDSLQTLRGKWIIELPEIQSSFTQSDINWLKKILTTGSDYYRPSYERRARDVPRESIFIATLNPNATGRYLKDSENRRYFPIATGVFDLKKLADNRDQYFAEALHRYRAGELSYIDDPEIEAEIKAAQDRRREKHPWHDLLEPWVANRPPGGFTLNDVYTLGLGLTGSTAQSTNVRTRVYEILIQLGYEYNAAVGGGKWTKRIKNWSEMI